MLYPQIAKVLLVSDGQGWIIDRITKARAEAMPEFEFEFETRNMNPEELLEKSKSFDLVHYTNWGIEKYKDVVKEIKTKQLLSINSHRHKPFLFELVKSMDAVHVVNPMLSGRFYDARYIPDGVFVNEDQIKSFKVGMAFQDAVGNAEYKGYPLVKEACKNLGVELEVSQTRSPDAMADWYRSLGVLVCASEAEGFNTPVMECLALNVPVITTDVGVPFLLNVTRIERNIEAIQSAIGKLYTTKQILPEYSWSNIGSKMSLLYKEILNEA